MYEVSLFECGNSHETPSCHPFASFCPVLRVILGKISSKVDARLLIGAGAIGTALVMFQLANITPQTGTDELFLLLVWRGAATVLMFSPLSLATLGSLPKQDISAGSGFYNLTRQLGGSVGIAILTTLLAQREVFHKAILSAKLTPYDLETSQRLDALTSAFQSHGSDTVTAH